MGNKRVITYWVRALERLVPVSVETRVPASKDWFNRLQCLANEMVWAHASEPEILVQFERDGLNLGRIDEGDLP